MLALAGTLPFVYLAGHGLVTALAVALVVRGAGMGAIGIPSISAAYASVSKRDLSMATTSLNIVQRLGGPTMTTVCATFLGWKLRSAGGAHDGLSHAFTAAFLLLCGLHLLLLASALRLPLNINRATEDVTEASELAEAVSG